MFSVVTGAVAIMWYVAWCLVVSESPVDHLTISRHELDYIQQGLTFRKGVNIVFFLW